MSKLKSPLTKRGEVSEYGYALGYLTRRDTATLSYSSNSYWVKWWTEDNIFGAKFNTERFRTLTEAKKFFSQVAPAQRKFKVDQYRDAK